MLEDLLSQHKDRVLKRWSDFVIQSYPADARQFLTSQKNRFANPVGASIYEGLAGLYEGLAKGDDLQPQGIAEALDRVVRIRAVQEFSPSQALGFIFFLKQAVRETLHQQLTDMAALEELATWESRIDRVALLAFDLYMQCSKTIFDIRCNEVKDSTARLWERICRKYGAPEACSDSQDNDSGPR
jgi:hypothetical protein